ncbi:response regulator [Hydrogenimonas urashimensis]|uniref:response regulator n=1 Tax=Hydrogenimonas urashimensis TaxID=2740515 RepID=UPI0019156BE4|nr:response regulator [Hydrogenimonas urashimensis]
MIDNDIIKIANETKKLNALVVEDEKEANELMVSTFGNFFNSVDSAMNAEEALEIYKKKKPDVIFIDIILPGMDGLELARKIREINPDQIIVIISASNDMSKISEAIKIGVDSFIQKPIDSNKIIDLLKNINQTIAKRKKIETKTFSITLPMDLYDRVHSDAKTERISKNAMIIRALKSFYNIKP